MPVAIDSPKFVQSNSIPKLSRTCKTVFRAPAIEVPTAPKSSGEISPFKN